MTYATQVPARSSAGNPEHDDALAAAQIAREAGELLLALRRRMHADGADPSRIKDEGDRRSHDFILDALTRRFPHDAVLSEEAADDAARLDADRVWIVDPLDGTREFSEEGRSDWAVHVALVAGADLVAGAVAMPALGATFTSADDVRPSVPSSGRVRIAVSRTRRPEVVLRLADALQAELVEMGSAGAKSMAVVRGEVDIYAHAGGQYEWDSAAPVAVARAAGLHASRIDGSELVYNRADPWLPDLLICRPELAAQALELLA